MEMMEMDFAKRWLSRILIALTLSAVYLYGYPSATISYSVVDLFHVALGIILTLLLFFFCFPLLRRGFFFARLCLTSLAAGALFGIVFIKIGTALRFEALVFAHFSLL